jgi:hypothetical protein
VYQDQKVHLYCLSLSFVPRRSRGLKTGEDKRQFLSQVHILGDPTQRAKDFIGKITNLFCIYLFQNNLTGVVTPWMTPELAEPIYILCIPSSSAFQETF